MAKTLTVYLAADLKKFNQGMDDAERRAKGLGSTMSGMVGPALIGAAAAAGAFALKIGVDGVKAAIEDEAAAAKLAQTLGNLGLAHNTKPVEDYISSLERSLGIADDELRPAYDRLVRSIGDVADANDALELALDISAGTGKSLQAVVEALGKAYDGNTAGLARLGAGIDSAVLKSGDMRAITADLSRTFSGQATTASQTYQGQIDRLSIGFQNLQEAAGYGLLNALNNTEKGTQDLVDTMAELEPTVETIATFIGNDLKKAAEDAAETTNILSDSWEAWQLNARDADSVLIGLVRTIAGTVKENEQLAAINRGIISSFEYTQYAAYDLEGSLNDVSTAADGATSSFTDLTPQLEENAQTALEAAGSYLTLYERIANADRAARDFAGTSGTVSSAIAAGTRRPNYLPRDDRFDDDETDKRKKNLRSLAMDLDKTSSATDKLADSTDRGQRMFRRLTDTVEETRGTLLQHLNDLESLTEQAEDYANGIRGGLEAGLDLAAAYQGQFTREGELTGVSLIEGFRRQVAHVKWFGDVLTAMKAQGADAGFIQEVAGLGPGIGGPLGEQLIKDGLVPTMSAEWVNVQDKINELGVQLVPEFMNQGIADAQALVNGMAEQLSKEGTRLSKLGKEIGKPVGASFKAQILEDVAEAVRAVEAAATAARAERVAQASAQQARVTEQAVAQAVASLVAKSDARTGRPSTAAPSRPVWVLG